MPSPPGKRSYSKLNPLTRDVLRGVEHWLINGEADDHSWEVGYEALVESGFDLDIPWPNASQITGAETAGEQLKDLQDRLVILGELTESLAQAHAELHNYPLQESIAIGEYVVEAGERAGSKTPDRFVGVSNAGGLAPFKGKPASDTSRYREIRPGDFVYNPMRVNVGSIALCRRGEGRVSPDYAVFRLTEDTPFDAEYLLMFLKSEQGRAELENQSRGAVRRRLYIDGLHRSQCRFLVTQKPGRH